MSDHSQDKNTSLIWVDIETTGLDERADSILEIVMVATPTANSKNFGIDLGQTSKIELVLKPEGLGALADLHPNVMKMHIENGLWLESFASDISLHNAQMQLENWMKGVGGVGSVMCGNTVGFDRKFIRYTMPGLHKLFHYRNLDVSSIRNMFEFHLGGTIGPKIKAHRSLDDIKESIKEYSRYLKMITSNNKPFSHFEVTGDE